MPGEDSNQSWIVVVGAIGIMSLLLVSLGYALRDSGTFFESEHINQIVIDQQAAAAEPDH